jgi:hypothetical protein
MESAKNSRCVVHHAGKRILTTKVLREVRDALPEKPTEVEEREQGTAADDCYQQ